MAGIFRQKEIANTERERLRADAAELKNQELLATVSWLQEQMSQLRIKIT